MSPKVKYLLFGTCGAVILAACHMQMPNRYKPVCPDGFVETANIGVGEESICCPYGTVGQDGVCVDAPQQFEAEQPAFGYDEAAPINEFEQDEPYDLDPYAEPVRNENTETQFTQTPPDDFVYLAAPNGKGGAYCPKKANSLAWNGVQFKCCGYGLKSVEVPSRGDSICCPVASSSARWIGEEGFDYECCPRGKVEVKNHGSGPRYICCDVNDVGKDGECVLKTTYAKEGKSLFHAPNNKGNAYCPEGANSVAWNGEKFQCCGKGMVATVVPSRGDSICCPTGRKSARWIGEKWSDYECCPKGTVETKNGGTGPKYLCCPPGNKAFDGECLKV